MANPNIVAASSIRGNVVGFAAPTTSTTIVSNIANSGQLLKINIISAANITASSATVSLVLYKAAKSYTVTNSAVVGTITSGAYTLTLPMSSGPFLSTSTSVSGTTVGTGATVGAITISGTNYSIAITGTSGATAGAQNVFSWTNPAVAVNLEASVAIPGNATLVLVSKDSGLYLEEGDYIYVSAGTANAVHVHCGYEVIS